MVESPRADLVVAGEVVLAARPHGLETAEAIGISGGRVVSAGDRDSVQAGAVAGARMIDAGTAAVVPGLHDAHIHLVDLARMRRELELSDAADFGELLARVAKRVADLAPEAWLLGRGWSADTLDLARLELLERMVGDRPAFLRSRDGHSAWASPALLLRAGIRADTAAPAGGRIERRADGEPNGVVRETAVELVRPYVERLRGDAMNQALAETVGELLALGITGVTDAGDFSAASGVGGHADLGDSFSTLVEGASVLNGRLRVTANVPMAALGSATSRRLRTGSPLDAAGHLRVGWLKLFGDGALGSRTAALFEPYSCEAGGDGTGFMTLTLEQLRSTIDAARAAGIGAAVHAIGDRANALVLDAFEASGSVAATPHRDRVEHAQLVRPSDRQRMARLGLVASMQPIHCLSDRATIDRCWDGRQSGAYAWRSLLLAGVPLAFGSDAPVETVDPWLGMQAAVHRRLPHDSAAWQPQERLSFAEALHAYTLGPALASGVRDEGHLLPGARADLAILDRPLRDLQGAETLATTRATVMLLEGNEP